MNFYEAMNQTQTNASVTENGMTGYKTTYHPLVDMNFKLASYRQLTDTDIVKDFKSVLASADAEYALKYLFMARDAREGLGERRFFRVCMKELLNTDFENKDAIVADLIQKQIVEFGRYDDLFVFMDTDYEDVMVNTILTQLKTDYANMQAGKSISLLGKWMPSANASSPATKKLAYKFMNALGASPRDYRKTLSALRAYSNVVEVLTSAKQWGDINYSAVPSKANLKYKNAFLRNDEDRRREFLAKLKSGNKTVHINSSVNFPHEIVAKYHRAGYCSRYLSDYDEALEQLWKNLKQKDGLKDTIVVRDGSGSMISPVGSGTTTALDVSTALALYCAERMNGDFKNKFITFSSQAKLVSISGTNLHRDLEICYRENDCSNTDIQNVFELILNTARDYKMSQAEMPKQVLIISDMEFDPTRDSSYWDRGMHADSNVFKLMNTKYAAAGYKLPKLVFWNVASSSNTIPCKENENGVLLVSGFSVNTLNQVLNGETDSYVSLIKELSTARYEAIPKLVLKASAKTETTSRVPTRRTSVRKTKTSYKPSFLD